MDGVILTGQTSINQAVMTGESLPVDKGPGDEVSSGTVNQFGAFEMRAAKVGEDSSIQRMIRLVQSADAGKAKIVGLADRWATWIVVIALTAAALTWSHHRDIIRAVTILVVFCPCALVLATPTAIMAAIGNATKHGFLVREGDALERLAAVSQVTFDKTGTLTYGAPQVTAVESLLPDVSGRSSSTRWAAGAELLRAPAGQGRRPGLRSTRPAPRRRRQRTSRCSPAGACPPGGGPTGHRRQPGAAGGAEHPLGAPVPGRRPRTGGGLHRHLPGGGRPPGGLSGPVRHPAAGRRPDHPGCPGGRRRPRFC